MPTDKSIQALREASPRGQTGFDEWVERFDPLKEQIPAAPVPAGLLQEGTADVRAPAGMTRQVARLRRRRLSLRSAVAALIAGAVALVAVVVPSDDTRGPTADTAYVVKRVESALSATGPGEIAQMTVTTRGDGPFGGPAATTTATAEEWSYGDQWRAVAYSPAGHPAYDEGLGSSSVYTWVSYLTQTWARQSVQDNKAAQILGSGSGCEPAAVTLPVLFQLGLPGSGFSASSGPTAVAMVLKAAISCGALAVAGRQRVDGIEAIELPSRPGSPVPETIWVSPDTYLPVRVAGRPAVGKPGLWVTADIIWLPATAQNLARLTVPIPAGFHQLPLGAVPLKP